LGLWGGRAMSEKDTAPDLWVMLGFVVLVGAVAFGFGRAGSKSSHVPASRPMTYGESGRLIVPSKKRQRVQEASRPRRVVVDRRSASQWADRTAREAQRELNEHLSRRQRENEWYSSGGYRTVGSERSEEHTSE